ncbi:UBP12 Ubiquitin C-terminal hydrolase [Pyrenophora tritici-repentis]|uniref:Ubiquitin carboxyl-terminal hydrolase n=2 Tax=Pyrenophora tritici-repentis TaxID=45151 RepID=A0A922NRA8_9PLEO|nr:Ubiquitin carboxyl-terminal hydrolase [Pyrenophora tritici-repentis]KAI1597378.1 UBP12 Ubiquitin C-terminal hydrolase [Pyrenophora tritici-repentis]KAI1675796.1 Ubiquitin carboxyl-terminal hydrolase [Pyrenophora tritici-repentis]KAI1687034.1 Ubiquitin carboxyl-terminal hydrolase [Pyrenophora tritici-repentis]
MIPTCYDNRIEEFGEYLLPNAVIQGLRTTLSFSGCLASVQPKAGIEETVARLFTQLNLGPSSGADSFSPLLEVFNTIAAHYYDDSNPTRRLRAQGFDVNESTMQDAAEFYDYFAEHMFPPIKSHLRDWFVQRFRKCAHCKAEMASGEKEVEHMIKVLIPDKVQALLKLQDMLPYDKWNEPEGFSCQKCSGQSHQVTERPLSLPNLFLVQLCRFRQGVQAKKTNLIQFPIGETEVIASAGTGKYRVDGVFYRSGIGVDTGHYYTISRDVEDSSRWVKWDDSQRSVVSVEEVVTNEAYILVMRQMTTQKLRWIDRMQQCQRRSYLVLRF